MVAAHGLAGRVVKDGVIYQHDIPTGPATPHTDVTDPSGLLRELIRDEAKLIMKANLEIRQESVKVYMKLWGNMSPMSRSKVQQVEIVYRTTSAGAASGPSAAASAAPKRSAAASTSSSVTVVIPTNDWLEVERNYDAAKLVQRILASHTGVVSKTVSQSIYETQLDWEQMRIGKDETLEVFKKKWLQAKDAIVAVGGQPPSEEQQVHRFLTAVRSVRKYAEWHTLKTNGMLGDNSLPKSMDELYLALSRYTALPGRRADSPSREQSSDAVFMTKARGGKPAQDKRGKSSTTDSSEEVCFMCGEKGHRSYSCPSVKEIIEKKKAEQKKESGRQEKVNVAVGVASTSHYADVLTTLGVTQSDTMTIASLPVEVSAEEFGHDMERAEGWHSEVF